MMLLSIGTHFAKKAVSPSPGSAQIKDIGSLKCVNEFSLI